MTAQALLRPIWYNEFPPRLRGHIYAPENESGSRPILIERIVLFVIGVLGVVLIAASPFLVSGVWETVLSHFGIAFMVSCILGFTVESFVRKRFTTRLARDVFEATIGHLLPTEFQDEMRATYNQKALCEEHDQNVYIRRDKETGGVKLECEMERKIRNISGEPTSIDLGVGVDEWFGTSPSSIDSFVYQKEGCEKVEVPLSEGRVRDLARGRPVLSLEQHTVNLGPNECVTVWLSYTEPLNSDHNSHFAYPTRNPKVRLHCDDGIEAVAGFPHETDENKMSYPGGRYEFKGLVRSNQEICIRWWERDKLNDWKAAAS
jgi:hypothetical protein